MTATTLKTYLFPMCVHPTTAAGDLWLHRDHIAKRDLATDDNDYWLERVGRAYYELGHPEEAIKYLTKCVAVKPDHFWGRYARGLTLMVLALKAVEAGDENTARQHLLLAIEDFTVVINLNKVACCGFPYRQSCYSLLERHQEALADMEEDKRRRSAFAQSPSIVWWSVPVE